MLGLHLVLEIIILQCIESEPKMSLDFHIFKGNSTNFTPQDPLIYYTLTVVLYVVCGCLIYKLYGT